MDARARGDGVMPITLDIGLVVGVAVHVVSLVWFAAKVTAAVSALRDMAADHEARLRAIEHRIVSGGAHKGARRDAEPALM